MTTSYNPQYDNNRDDEEPLEEKNEAQIQQLTAQSLSVLPKTKQATSNSLIHSLSSKQKNKSNISTVEKIISITPTCYLKPKAFFVAWNSVITLVFTGWPEPIDTMKSELSSQVNICKEMFGSKFPKITLACVKDGFEMTPKLLKQIRNLCQNFVIPKDYVLCMDSLSIVLYENRSQESIIYEKVVPLKRNHKFMGSPNLLKLEMEEDNDSPYLRSGNRTSHYRSLHVGSSIVYKLYPSIPKWITDFQSKLPQDVFDTFSKDSLHITVRALT